MISISLKQCLGTGDHLMKAGQDRKHQSPQPVTSVRAPLMILADDLSGACDAAIAFTSSCDPVRVRIGVDVEPSETAYIQAGTTQSRHTSVAEAEFRIRNIVKRLPLSAELFKKIDSIFRGNTFAEIAATLRCARFDFAILAPAYPALGRTVSEGTLHIRDTTG